jgi:Zn-dependent protease
MDFLFDLLIIIASAIVHEVSHGLMARALGDKTAQYAGRLTLNPVAHIDLYGSILLPLALWFMSGGTFFFASAKPVPYNPYNLKNQQWGPAAVGAAGPATNLLIAAVFALLIHAIGFNNAFGWLFVRVVIINCSLAIFNLIPIPPLDGSKILFALLPTRYDHYKFLLERYGFFFVFIFVFFFGGLISWPVQALVRVLLG